ncbi:kinase-like protein [Gigaspora margarita]|uniref:Kinase-like protein n=1 Tax=Gigaspora margarita TaxID=4874 RepID=A0A8H4AK86_GIGMA|nr:kinase-like protein [Gigaspora margarita]
MSNFRRIDFFADELAPFIPLIGVVNKDFTLDISRTSYLKNFTSSQIIKDRFDKIILDFEQAITDLNLAIIVSNADELNSIKETVQLIHNENIFVINQIKTMILTFKNMAIEKTYSAQINKIVRVKKIDPNYFGPLNDWKLKLKIARNILHDCDYIHHKIHCENILITDDMNTKISNFKTSRKNTEKSEEIENDMHWLAPEKMQVLAKKLPYSKESVVFSFGMLL